LVHADQRVSFAVSPHVRYCQSRFPKHMRCLLEHLLGTMVAVLSYAQQQREHGHAPSRLLLTLPHLDCCGAVWCMNLPSLTLTPPFPLIHPLTIPSLSESRTSRELPAAISTSTAAALPPDAASCKAVTPCRTVVSGPGHDPRRAAPISWSEAISCNLPRRQCAAHIGGVT
jgi:hypothetical protein